MTKITEDYDHVVPIARIVTHLEMLCIPSHMPDKCHAGVQKSAEARKVIG